MRPSIKGCFSWYAFLALATCILWNCIYSNSFLLFSSARYVSESRVTLVCCLLITRKAVSMCYALVTCGRAQNAVTDRLAPLAPLNDANIAAFEAQPCLALIRQLARDHSKLLCGQISRCRNEWKWTAAAAAACSRETSIQPASLF